MKCLLFRPNNLPALKEILEIGIWQDSLMATVLEVACYVILRCNFFFFLLLGIIPFISS